MSNEDFDSMLAEITDADTPVATLPQEDKPVTEPTPEDVPAHTELEDTMPDMPTPVGKDGGQPLYAEIDPSLKKLLRDGGMQHSTRSLSTQQVRQGHPQLRSPQQFSCLRRP